jgi:alpha-tubulin suppressor-like RCC1 family protein
MGLLSGLCSYPTNGCGTATCSGTQIVATGICNGNGSCSVPAAQNCAGNYVCSASACKTSCTADADCLSGYFCESGSCHLAAVAVATGEWHACVLLTDGSIRCWGRGGDGELGNGKDQDSGFEESPTPVPVMGLPGPASAIAAASDSVCALIKSDGSVWCWGSGASGQFGNGTIPTNDFEDSSTPVKSNLAGASAISMEFDNQVCAIVSGSVYCWGGGVLTPTKVAGVSGVTAIASGDYHTCAGGGTSVWCWGDNSAGELGNGSMVSTETPQAVQLAALKGGSILALAAGSDLSCGLFGSGGSGGGVYCWGSITATTTPQAVPGFSGATTLEGGEYEVCGINGSGALLCWGIRNDTPVGDPQPTNPGVVAGMPTPVISVASGISDPVTCAVAKDGAAWCWTFEAIDGILGSDTLSGSTTPVQIPGW